MSHAELLCHLDLSREAADYEKERREAAMFKDGRRPKNGGLRMSDQQPVMQPDMLQATFSLDKLAVPWLIPVILLLVLAIAAS